MVKEKKITFKYSIHKKKKPELNKDGDPIYRLYVRVTYNRVSTKFSLPYPLDHDSYQGDFSFPKVEEAVFENLERYQLHNSLKEYEKFVEKIVRFEALQYGDSYSIINIKNRLVFYSKLIAGEVSVSNYFMILSELEDVLSFKKYNQANNIDPDNGGFINDGCFLSLFLYYFIESNFNLKIEDYLSEEEKILLCVSFRFQYFLSNFNSTKYTFNISDWIIGNLQKEFRLYLRDKKYLNNNNVFKKFDNQFQSIFSKYIFMYELPIEHHITLISKKLINKDLRF